MLLAEQPAGTSGGTLRGAALAAPRQVSCIVGNVRPPAAGRLQRAGGTIKAGFMGTGAPPVPPADSPPCRSLFNGAGGVRLPGAPFGGRRPGPLLRGKGERNVSPAAR